MQRVLHISMYPYIPEAEGAALLLKQGFEDSHPGVLLRITLNQNYYATEPSSAGVLYEDADVHEIDAIFLRDFTDRHKLQPLSPALVASLGPQEPLAAAATTQDGQVFGAPHWMCTDFLFYPAGRSDLSHIHNVADLEKSLQPADGLLLDLARPALGELILSARLSSDGDPADALGHLSESPSPALIHTMQMLLALEPAGFGRSEAYDARAGFYARQFARRAGGAFVGYSEATHDMLDETETSCRDQDRCLTQADLRVAPWPSADARRRQAVWVDFYGIDAKLHGVAREDAENFIRFAMQVTTYRALLVPSPGAPPRYLLPARADIYTDAAVLKAAPLYARFHELLSHGVVVTAPNLNAHMHEAARLMDAELPPSH